MEWFKQLFRVFGVKNPQVESLHEWNISGLKVRVWRTQRSVPGAMLANVDDIDVIMRTSSFGDAQSVIEALNGCKRIACIAIVDQNGNGVSYYPDWH